MKSLSGEEVWQDLGAKYFRDLSTFGALSDGTVRRLLAEGRVLQLDQGDVLFHAGDKVTGFHVMLKGDLAVYFQYRNMHALTRHYHKGEELGFVAMIGLHDRAATAVAHEDSLVVAISTDQFYDLHEQAPDDFGLLMINLAREMARSLRMCGELVVQLTMQAHQGRQPE